jgi:CHAT domain-containing protein/Tfp pilus assembly protein PilF
VSYMNTAHSTRSINWFFLSFPGKACTGLFLITTLLFSNVFSQNGESPEEVFKKAENLFIFDDVDLADSLFSSIENQLCENKDYYELCVDARIYRSAAKRYAREFELSDELLMAAEEFSLDKLPEGHPVLVKIYSQRTYLNEELTQLDVAESWADKALEYKENYSLKGKHAARAYLAKGFISSAKGNYHASVEYYKSALNEVEGEERSINLLRLLSQAHNNIGVDYRRLGMSSEAMYHYQQARDVVKDVFGENHPEMALIYNSLGSVYYGTGDYGTAAEFFVRSAAIFKDHFGEVHNRVAVAYNNAGICYFRLGNLDKAAEHFEFSQRVKEEIYESDHLDLAVGYNTLGSLYAELGQHDLAEENYQLSIQVRKNIYGEEHPTLIAPIIALSRLYIQTESASMARQQLQTALDIGLSRLGQSHPDIIDIYSLYALSYFNEGLYDSANEYYDKALHLIFEGEYSQFKETGSNFSELNYPVKAIENIRSKNRLLNSLYKKTGDISHLYEALMLAGIASEIIDLLQTSYQSEASKLNLIDTNYEIYSGAVDIVYELYVQTGEESWLEEILFYSEKSRSRIALELLQNVEARNFGGVPMQVLDRERELNERVTKFYQQLNLEEEKGDSADSELIDQYTDSLFYAHRDISAFTQNLEKEYPSYFLLKYDRRLADLKDIQAMISENETVISYTFGVENLYVLVIDKRGLRVVKLEIEENFAERIEQLLRSVTGGHTEAYQEEAFKLYTQLMEPLISEIETGSVIIIADQALHYLPFEMLITEESSGKMYHQMPFLIKNYQIQYTPSATVMMTKQGRRSEDPQNLLALAPFYQSLTPNDIDVDYSGERDIGRFTQLPLTGFETREIAKLFRQRNSVWSFFFPEQAEVLTDQRASKSRILNGSLEDYGYIHFATHAFVNERDPALSGIALYSSDDEDGGIIYVSDIYNLQMNADLVVLGACETGLGDIRRGEGLIGFTRAFFYAGASNMVVSMWRVNDQPTAHLMINFYRYIRDGQSYGRALQNAKLDLINHPEYAAPRNWAAFVLKGR